MLVYHFISLSDLYLSFLSKFFDIKITIKMANWLILIIENSLKYI